MDWLLYYVAKGLVTFIQVLPLRWVVALGRAGGALAYRLDARHRRVVLRNLTMCLGGEKSEAELQALARENFRRIGENFACAAKTAAMPLERLREHMEIVGVECFALDSAKPRGIICAIGHFGNFELFARAAQSLSTLQGATTYRALRSPGLNRLLLSLRERSGCRFYERRLDGAALREALATEPILLGLLSDQHAGDHGLRIPFFGHDCSTTKSPAVFALRYQLPLHSAICYRTRPGHWRIEIGPPIPTRSGGSARAVPDIMADVNLALEMAIRRDPANWFWVHNRWKPPPPNQVRASPPADPVKSPEASEET
jgi:KDO2-lipid IV(A) lauroyltransferase